MFKFWFLILVLSNSVYGNSLLITDSFSMNVDKRLSEIKNSAKTLRQSKFKYNHYFTWILKNLLNIKLDHQHAKTSEWPALSLHEKSTEGPTHLSLMSSNLEDFNKISSSVSASFDEVVVYTPLLDLCNLLAHHSSSTNNYVSLKFKKVIQPLVGSSAKIKVIHSNNVLSWMGRRESQQKSQKCMSNKIEDLMVKFTFCPRLALLLQQKIPKDMLTTVANEMRELKVETAKYVKESGLGVQLLSQSDYLDLAPEHFGSDCVHLNTKGHQRLALKFKDLW